MQTKPLISKLTTLGLSEKQAQIYTSALIRKRATVLEISRDTGIERPTIYENSRTLEEMGLLTVVLVGVKKYLVVDNPERLYTLVEEKRKIAKDVVEDISALVQGEPLRTSVKLYAGSEGAKRLSDAILKSKSKRIQTLGNYGMLTRLFSKKYLHELWVARSRRGIHARILFPSSDLSTLLESSEYGEIGNIRYERNTRILPEKIAFNAMYTIVDDNVLFWSDPMEDFFFLFKSKSYAESLLTVFDFLWEQSRDIETCRVDEVTLSR